MSANRESKPYEKLVEKYIRKHFAYKRQVNFKTDNGNNIRVDFLLTDINIVVEVDGSEHSRGVGKMYDKWRDEYLRSIGYNVVRFTNEELDEYGNYSNYVVDKILSEPVEREDRPVYDIRDYSRLAEVYNAMCESISEYILQDRLKGIEMRVFATDDKGEEVVYNFGLSRYGKTR